MGESDVIRHNSWLRFSDVFVNDGIIDGINDVIVESIVKEYCRLVKQYSFKKQIFLLKQQEPAK